MTGATGVGRCPDDRTPPDAGAGRGHLLGVEVDPGGVWGTPPGGGDVGNPPGAPTGRGVSLSFLRPGPGSPAARLWWVVTVALAGLLVVGLVGGARVEPVPGDAGVPGEPDVGALLVVRDRHRLLLAELAPADPDRTRVAALAEGIRDTARTGRLPEVARAAERLRRAAVTGADVDTLRSLARELSVAGTAVPGSAGAPGSEPQPEVGLS